MKKINLFTTLAFLTITSQLFANTDLLDTNPNCHEQIVSHLETIDSSNKYFEKLSHFRNVELTANQTTSFILYLEERLISLSKLKNSLCQKQSIKEAVIFKDYNDQSKIIFSDFKLRRVVKDQIKSKNIIFSNLKDNYVHYTKTDTLDEINELVRTEKTEDIINELNLELKLSSIKPMTTVSDVGLNIAKGTLTGLAYTWGKFSDATVWRSGRLNQNYNALSLVRANLKPFDLIFESREYTLSHLTIPGHFGHVAVWMGTKEELIEMNLWNQEFMSPFRSQIEKGNNIIEVRKNGVVFNSLENFMNLDEMAITRITDIEKNAKEIFSKFHKLRFAKYDFAFDSHTTSKITCTEFIAFSYGDIKWPASNKLSIISIRPDDIALLTKTSPEKSQLILRLNGNEDFKTFTKIDNIDDLE